MKKRNKKETKLVSTIFIGIVLALLIGNGIIYIINKDINKDIKNKELECKQELTELESRINIILADVCTHGCYMGFDSLYPDMESSLKTKILIYHCAENCGTYYNISKLGDNK